LQVYLPSFPSKKYCGWQFANGSGKERDWSSGEANEANKTQAGPPPGKLPVRCCGSNAYPKERDRRRKSRQTRGQFLTEHEAWPPRHGVAQNASSCSTPPGSPLSRSCAFTCPDAVSVGAQVTAPDATADQPIRRSGQLRRRRARNAIRRQPPSTRLLVQMKTSKAAQSSISRP
jgi:hypothetical protein